MNTLARLLSLLSVLIAFQLDGFGQITIVGDDYQLNLGGLEEIKLDDLDSKWDFEFSVGDSIYVTESTHKLLRYNKNTNKASIEALKVGPYVVQGICFGDSIDQLHNTIEQYDFDDEYDKQEAHARIYSFKLRNKLRNLEFGEGLCICGDTTFSIKDKYNIADIVSFYQSDKGKTLIQMMNDYKNDRDFIRKTQDQTRAAINKTRRSQDYLYIFDFCNVCLEDIVSQPVAYKIENENGDVFLIDQREMYTILVGKKVREEERYFLKEIKAKKILVLKVSDYQKHRDNLVGKDFYIMNIVGYIMGENVDYITKKEIHLKDRNDYGKMIEDATTYNLGVNRYNDEKDMQGIDDFYRCKDIVIRKGEYVVVFSNSTGEFSAFLEIHNKEIYNPYYRYADKEGYCFKGGIIEIIPKSLIDSRINEYKLSEQEKKQKMEKDNQERIAQQKKHDAEIIAKYGENYGNMILQHKVAIGMNKEMCREAGWYPRDTFKTTTSKGVSEIWVINYKTRLYFTDGVLYKIEN